MTSEKNQNPSKDIFEACEQNDLEGVKKFIEVEGTPITSRNRDNETPAHSAAKKGHVLVLEYLLEKQPDLQNAKDNHGNNILHLATVCGSLDLVKYLITERGMDIYEPASAHLGNGAAHIAAYAGWVHLVKYFVEEKQVDVNLRNRIGQPLAFAAALNRKLKVIKYLLEECNANFFLTDDNNSNMLLISASVGDLKIPIYLLEEMKMKYKVDWRDRFGRTVLHYAARKNHLVIVKYFVGEKKADFNAQDVVGRSPLHEAAEKNYLEIIEYLMQRGASVFVKDTFGRTPLAVTKDKRIIQYLEQYVPPERKRRSVQESSQHVLPEMRRRRLYESFFRSSIPQSSVREYIAGKPSNETSLSSSLSQHVNEFLLFASIKYANKLTNFSVITPKRSILHRIDIHALEAVHEPSVFKQLLSRIQSVQK